MGLSLTPANPFFYAGTRAQYAPSADYLNVSMDFNAAPSGAARGTEVIIPDNATPEVRAAAERYNQLVADFAARNGIADYPIRGVRTRSENGRGVPHTIHAEPFFNSDTAFQEAVKANPAEFAAIYQQTFGSLPNARAIAPHGVGNDRGAASDIFGSETDFGMYLINAALGGDYELPQGGTPRQTVSTNSPQGLLPTMQQEAPQMQQEKVGGLLGRLFPNMEADRADEIRLGLQGLLHNPNEARVGAIQARMGERADNRKTQAAAAQAQQQANRTAQWLAQQPGGQQYAQAIASGALPAGEALQMWRQASQGQEPTALMQNVEYIRQQNPGMSMQEALQLAKSGTTVNVSGSAPAPATGWRNVYDEQGRLVAQEPIPGGPVDTEQRQAAQAEAERQQSAANQQGVRDTVIGRDVDRLVGMIDRGGIFNLPESGIIGGLLGSMGINQEAVDFGNSLKSIQATIAFDTLKQMRDASKTGGALGAVSERELDLLISAYGALQQNTSPEVLRENLLTIKNVMTKIASDPVASSYYYGGGQASQGQAPSGGFSVTGRID
jgi:hypothetical protein